MMKLAIAVLVVFGFLSAVEADWREGRATFYGDQPWLWDINKGSCGFGQLDPNKGTGWDIAAMPDGHYEYSGSCGMGWLKTAISEGNVQAFDGTGK
ncbi:hypothetical protein BSKO_12376 [Bryopsis sp. KO-2023]|nr:hypothetical protein BSKO_12376 [Bryopsis sp. KO-2023]